MNFLLPFFSAKQWAEKFGAELSLLGEEEEHTKKHPVVDSITFLGEYITRKKEVASSFQKAQIVNRSGETIVEDIEKEIKKMMDARISAIRRLVDTAQEIGSISASNDEVVERNFTYFNAKEMIEPSEVSATPPPPVNDGEDIVEKENPKPVIYLSESEKFSDYINLSISSVHVPTNVYDRAKDVIKAIKWSEMLDNIFDSNYKRDPSLFWQYFCSSTGFLRQFPATKWKWVDPVDLYDCRIRHWYIAAANSPKDVIILIDNSGSMMGQKKDIARHIAENILDTLTPNDFVNIFTFSDEIDDLIECFGDQLVQADSANIRAIKESLVKIETNELANFSAAMTKAFDTLFNFREEHGGANCNQAIMLISDGLPVTVDDVFETYNWKDRDKGIIPVRVFTYLIGREVPDVKNIKQMACDNRGFYVHLSTHAEVRERVLESIPVMARPLVLNRTHHPVVFSQVYADVIVSNIFGMFKNSNKIIKF
jgi:voltage-dependent calcium channel alpha-2/delta-3